MPAPDGWSNALVVLAPGYEHPGDPRQPDNTRRTDAHLCLDIGGTNALVVLAPGYEHPGDPRQPDNTRRTDAHLCLDIQLGRT